MNIFKRVKEDISPKDLIPLKNIYDNLDHYKENFNINFPSYSVVKEALEYLEQDINSFYFSNKGLTPFYYYKLPVLVEIHNFDIEILQSIQVKERIDHSSKVFNKAIEEKDFTKLLALMDQRMVFTAYQEYFDLIPDSEKFELFMDIYVGADYGFTNIDSQFLEKVFSYKTEEDHRQVIDRLREDDIYNDKIKIYRGANTESNSIDQAYSWTTSLNTAIFFATRFNNPGSVYEALVDVNNIVDYIDRRNESEVIVRPKDLIEPKKIDFLTSKEVINLLEKNGLIEIYGKFARKIKNNWFESPKGVHGVLHAKRVLLLNLILGFYEKVKKSDINILAYASIYHDIGRINDHNDPDHGKNSVKKIDTLKLPLVKNTEEVEIIKYIVSVHNIHDEEGAASLNKYNIKDKDRAKYLLKIFKDGDGLDRVRIKDLNTKYFRLDISKQLILVAHDLLQNIE